MSSKTKESKKVYTLFLEREALLNKCVWRVSLSKLLISHLFSPYSFSFLFFCLLGWGRGGGLGTSFFGCYVNFY